MFPIHGENMCGISMRMDIHPSQYDNRPHELRGYANLVRLLSWHIPNMTRLCGRYNMDRASHLLGTKLCPKFTHHINAFWTMFDTFSPMSIYVCLCISISIPDAPCMDMYGIFTYIWVIFRVSVGKYSIHGACGYHFLCLSLCLSGVALYDFMCFPIWPAESSRVFSPHQAWQLLHFP